MDRSRKSHWRCRPFRDRRHIVTGRVLAVVRETLPPVGFNAQCWMFFQSVPALERLLWQVTRYTPEETQAANLVT